MKTICKVATVQIERSCAFGHIFELLITVCLHSLIISTFFFIIQRVDGLSSGFSSRHCEVGGWRCEEEN